MVLTVSRKGKEIVQSGHKATGFSTRWYAVCRFLIRVGEGAVPPEEARSNSAIEDTHGARSDGQPQGLFLGGLVPRKSATNDARMTVDGKGLLGKVFSVRCSEKHDR